MDFRESADCGEILRGALQHALEFIPRLVEVPGLHQGTPKRDAGGEIRRMALQSDAAGLYRLGVVAYPAVLFSERRKRNRRRIRKDPASQLFYARIVRHESDFTIRSQLMMTCTL